MQNYFLIYLLLHSWISIIQREWFNLSWNSWESLILYFEVYKIYEGKENFSYLCGVARVLMNLEADLNYYIF